MSNKVIIIDGHSILSRAFYGIPELTNAEGLHTNAIYGFLNIIFKILDEEQADHLVVAFDSNAPTFRHKMFAEYKGTRKPMPIELKEQVPVMQDVLHTMNIPTIAKPGYEADDIIGTLSKRFEKEGFQVSVVSGDRDLLQLCTDTIKVRIPKTKMTGTEIEDYYSSDVKEKYGVTPIEFIDLKALMGDTSDNIPGVPGIGEKTATKLITTYGSIENAYVHNEEIKPIRIGGLLRDNYDLAVLSKDLATINVESPIDINIEETRIHDMFNSASYEAFKRLELKNLLKRFDFDEVINKEQIKVKIVSDFAELESIFAEASKGENVGFWATNTCDERGFVLVSSIYNIYYIKEDGFITGQYVVDKLQKLMDKGVLVSVMDLKSLINVETEDVLKIDNANKIFDCKIAAYLINPISDDYSHDNIAKSYADEMVPSAQDLFKKNKIEDVYKNDFSTFALYAGYMAYVPFIVTENLKNKLSELDMLNLYNEIEMPLVFVMKEMEKNGIAVNEDELKEYSAKLGERIDELEKLIYERAGQEFNINSPKQLGTILFEVLRLPYGKKTAKGYSTAVDVLEKLKMEDPIIGYILEYRQLTKLKSTYADGLVTFIAEDGRIHSTFNQTITATGRISSTDPNLQNIPIRMELGRMIRKAFVPKDGFVFVDADYSQIELRVLAHMSGDKTLIEAYNEGKDIHATTASQVFNVPLNEVTSLQRRNAKAVNFGMVYGISAFGLSEDLGISRKEAQSYMDAYFEVYPDVKNYMHKCVEDAKEAGYSLTMFGRRRPIPELMSNVFMKRAFGERVAMNAPIQGTAADIIKIAMINVYKRLKKEDLKSKLLLQVHDELLIEASLDEEEIIKNIIVEEMEKACVLNVPLVADCSFGNNWYEAK